MLKIAWPSGLATLLRKFAEGQGQSAGEFFTPKEIGWLMAELMDPQEGESFDIDGWRVEVVDMDGNRIDKLILVPQHAGIPAEAQASA